MDKLWVVIKREYLERVRSQVVHLHDHLRPGVLRWHHDPAGLHDVKGMKNAKVSSIRILDATGTGLGHRVADRLASRQGHGGTLAA